MTTMHEDASKRRLLARGPDDEDDGDLPIGDPGDDFDFDDDDYVDDEGDDEDPIQVGPRGGRR